MGNLQTRISLSVKWSWSLPAQTSCSSRGQGPFCIMRSNRPPPETSWIPRNEGVQGQERRWSDSMQVAVPSESGVFLPHSLCSPHITPHPPLFPPKSGPGTSPTLSILRTASPSAHLLGDSEQPLS